MDNRYSNTSKILNNSNLYKQFLKDRKLNSITQYATYDFSKLKDIDQFGFDYVLHKVEPFERLYMISEKYYNTPQYGWLICYINKIPNELQINAGDLLTIYIPLERVLGIM